MTIIVFLVGFLVGFFAACFFYVTLARLRKEHYDGAMNIKVTAEGKIFSLELYRDPEDLEDQDEVRFLVKDKQVSQ